MPLSGGLILFKFSPGQFLCLPKRSEMRICKICRGNAAWQLAVEKTHWILLAFIKMSNLPELQCTISLFKDCQRFPYKWWLKSGQPHFQSLWQIARGHFPSFFLLKISKIRWKSAGCQGALQAKRAWETKRGTSVAKNTGLQGGIVFFSLFFWFWFWDSTFLIFWQLFSFLFFLHCSKNWLGIWSCMF